MKKITLAVALLWSLLFWVAIGYILFGLLGCAHLPSNDPEMKQSVKQMFEFLERPL